MDPSSWRDQLLSVEIAGATRYTVCRVIGELDALTVGRFRQAVSRLGSRERLVVDLSGVPFMDSAGLGVLVSTVRRARESGGEVTVACARPSMLGVLRATGLDRIVRLSPSIEEAASVFARQVEP